MAVSGPIDHLVLSVASGRRAGLSRDLDLGAVPDGELWAYLGAVRAALPHLSEEGSVLMVTAGSARTAAAATSGPAACNGALNAMVGPLALELAPVRVNAICPGIVETAIFERWPDEVGRSFVARAAPTPVGRAGRPEEVAAMALAILVNRLVTGSVVDCDGGIRLGG